MDRAKRVALIPGAATLGGWRWLAGLLWTLIVTVVWTRIFLRMAWKWFGL